MVCEEAICLQTANRDGGKTVSNVSAGLVICFSPNMVREKGRL